MASYAGSERVVEQMLAVLPDADVFAVANFLPSSEATFLGGRRVRTSFIQRLPFAKRHYRAYLPLMPLAVEAIDLSGYHLVISSSHAVAKGVVTGPDQLHICMCYSPMRYAWDLQHQYLSESGLNRGLRGLVAHAILHWMRIWDTRTTNGVDKFIAISQFIARRIEKAYRRQSAVIYPPVDTGYFIPGGRRDPFYLTVSRLVPYKRVGMIVEAFADLPESRLIVVGDGPEMGRIRSRAGPNVELLGRQETATVRDLMQRARAFVFAAEEDFGIATAEAQACGTPAIVYRGGAAPEVVRGWRPGVSAPSNPTGVFFDEQTPAAIANAVRAFERDAPPCTADACRAHAETFGIDRFRREFEEFIQMSYKEYTLYRAPGVTP